MSKWETFCADKEITWQKLWGVEAEYKVPHAPTDTTTQQTVTQYTSIDVEIAESVVSQEYTFTAEVGTALQNYLSVTIAETLLNNPQITVWNLQSVIQNIINGFPKFVQQQEKLLVAIKTGNDDMDNNSNKNTTKTGNDDMDNNSNKGDKDDNSNKGDKDDNSNKGEKDDNSNNGDMDDTDDNSNKGDKDDNSNKGEKDDNSNKGDNDDNSNKGDKDDNSNKGDKDDDNKVIESSSQVY